MTGKKAVRIERRIWNFKFTWTKGDIPVFDENGEFIVGLSGAASVDDFVANKIPFGERDYARLPHVLVDPLMENELHQIRSCKSREELDDAKTDPWEGVAQLVNNEYFMPDTISTFPRESGISRSHISMINPTVLVSEQRPDMLSATFGKHRSDYGVSYANFRNSGQNDNSAFPSFGNDSSWLIHMYIFVFLHKYPHLLQYFITSIPEEEQREEVTGEIIADRDDEYTPKNEGRKCTDVKEIIITGFEEFKTAFICPDTEMSSLVEKETYRKATSEAEEAEYQSQLTLLRLIKDSRKMREEATHDCENNALDSVIQKLLKKINV